MTNDRHETDKIMQFRLEFKYTESAIDPSTNKILTKCSKIYIT